MPIHWHCNFNGQKVTNCHYTVILLSFKLRKCYILYSLKPHSQQLATDVGACTGLLCRLMTANTHTISFLETH